MSSQTQSSAFEFSASANSACNPDPVRLRVAAASQRTNSEGLSGFPSTHHEPTGLFRRLLPIDMRNPGSRRTHVGDILFWVACCGGVSVLLIAATR